MFSVKIDGKSVKLLNLKDYMLLLENDTNYIEIIEEYFNVDADAIPKSLAEFYLLSLIGHSNNSDDILYQINDKQLIVNLNMLSIIEKDNYVIKSHDDSFNISFREPTMSMNNDNPVDILVQCIDKVYINGEVLSIDDLSPDDFISVMSIITEDKFDEIIDNLTNRVVLYISNESEIIELKGFDNILEVLV